MDFKDLLAALFAGEVMPDDSVNQITEAYEFDMSIPRAQIDELGAQLALKDAEITALKLRNYELLENGSNDDTVVEEDNETVDTDITTDDLFTDPEEDN